MVRITLLCIITILIYSVPGFASGGEVGVIRGVVTDDTGAAVADAVVRLLPAEGEGEGVKLSVTSTVTGEFSFAAVAYGSYIVTADVIGFKEFQVPVVVKDASTRADIELTAKEMVLNVKARLNKVHAGSTSGSHVTQDQIAQLPKGDQTELPQVIATTTPGVIEGPLGELFVRGNYESGIQYQIDGVELPDLPGVRFGEVFTTRNVERFDVITGGFPAEYGQRLGGVVNIVTKSGSLTPEGSAEMSYGSYNTFSPTAVFGDATPSGDVHYLLSANYQSTERGLGTPQPQSTSNVDRGGEDAVHDFSNGNNELAKIDWILGNRDKVSLVLFDVSYFFQIPNFPSSFSPTDTLFTQPDPFGNPPYRYVPSDTNDTQSEQNYLAQVSWKHIYSDRAFLQLASYWKGTDIQVGNDLTNDLSGTMPGGTNASFTESRSVSNAGIQGDFTWRPDDKNKIKTGFYFQNADSTGSFTIVTATNTPANQKSFSDNTPDSENLEAVYVEDDFTPYKPLTFNAGIRFNATQFDLGAGGTPGDSALQPRLGASYLLTDTTKFHAFYGILYHPAPLDDLRAAFNFINGGGTLAPYDIKSEIANYYEAGISQELPANQSVSLTYFYKFATNWLDDAQLLNTYLLQPINYASGFSYGLDFGLRGDVTPRLSYYLNYSYLIAMVEGLTGGIFTGVTSSPYYQYLDTSQTHTANAGVTYRQNAWWASVQALYGSGLPTGINNSVMLPSHFTMDLAAGYEFHGGRWWDSHVKLSGGLLNIFDNPYPITIANGLTGSQYAAGQEFILRLSSEM